MESNDGESLYWKAYERWYEAGRRCVNDVEMALSHARCGSSRGGMSCDTIMRGCHVCAEDLIKALRGAADRLEARWAEYERRTREVLAQPDEE